jgi:hypothetical protein
MRLFPMHPEAALHDWHDTKIALQTDVATAPEVDVTRPGAHKHLREPERRRVHEQRTER